MLEYHEAAGGKFADTAAAFRREASIEGPTGTGTTISGCFPSALGDGDALRLLLVCHTHISLSLSVSLSLSLSVCLSLCLSLSRCRLR